MFKKYKTIIGWGLILIALLQFILYIKMLPGWMLLDIISMTTTTILQSVGIWMLIRRQDEYFYYAELKKTNKRERKISERTLSVIHYISYVLLVLGIFAYLGLETMMNMFILVVFLIPLAVGILAMIDDVGFRVVVLLVSEAELFYLWAFLGSGVGTLLEFFIVPIIVYMIVAMKER